jgi:hypothetical protein
MVLAGLLLAVVGFVAWHDGHDPRLQTVGQLVRDLDQHGLKCAVEQGGGGYFVLGDAWGVGGDFEWLARRVQEAIGGTVCELGVVDGTCHPLDSGQ